MNKQDAKRAATLATATTVGSASGTIGAGSIINNTSYEESLADQNNNSMDTEDNHTSLETPHIYHSSEEINFGVNPTKYNTCTKSYLPNNNTSYTTNYGVEVNFNNT